MRFLLALLFLSLPALAQGPTLSGHLTSLSREGLILKLADGSLRVCRFLPTTRFTVGGQSVSRERFRAGMRVAVVVKGSPVGPVDVAQVADWESSQILVARTATAPSYTPQGDFPSTGGVATSPRVRPERELARLGLGGSSNVLSPIVVRGLVVSVGAQGMVGIQEEGRVVPQRVQLAPGQSATPGQRVEIRGTLRSDSSIQADSIQATDGE